MKVKVAREKPRDLSHTATFKNDYKREAAGRHGKTLEEDLRSIVRRLAMDQPLDRKNVDHPLKGE
jgi:mRNA interferase YafQ